MARKIYLRDRSGNIVYPIVRIEDVGELQTELNAKQGKLTAGTNITISSDNVISATGSGAEYTAGNGIEIASNVISIDEDIVATQEDLEDKQDKLTVGNNIQIENNIISATDTVYTAGTGININNQVISVNDTIATTEALAAEITRSTSAEATLTTDLNTEIANRESADTTLQTNITTEVNARTAADTNLQTQIDNLKSIGRFLAIWDASTGNPTSEPPVSPYTFKVGDYYRVGVAGTKNPAPNLTYETGGINWVEGDELKVGDVIYISTITESTTTWVVQQASGGGTVQDVQINNSSILSGSVANIPIATTSNLGVVKATSGNGLIFAANGQISTNPASVAEITAKSNGFDPITPNRVDNVVMEGLGNSTLTWTDTYKQNARNTIGAGTVKDVQVNNISVLDSNNNANIVTNSPYNASTNKITTMTDIDDMATETWVAQNYQSSLTVNPTTTTSTLTGLTINGTAYAIESGSAGEGAVRYDVAQSLTDSQKSQARSNIDVPTQITIEILGDSE